MIRVALTPEQFAAKAEQLKAEGVDLLGQTSGVIDHEGVTAKWSYDGSRIEVTVTHKPMLYPEGAVEAKIATWLAAPPA